MSVPKTRGHLFASALALTFTLALLAADEPKPTTRPAASNPASQPASRAATQPVDEKAVAELIVLLGDNVFSVREDATHRLIGMGQAIYPLLEARLKERNLEQEAAARINTVLDDMTGWPFDANEAIARQEKAARDLGIPKELVLDLGNNVTMKMVLIPAGQFMMGSPQTEAKRGEDEPPHKVVLTKPFRIGVYPVTQEQYEAVMGKNPSEFRGAANPVETVSWYDAIEFCKNLCQKTSKMVRLPTEAQWEYACRAGTATPFNTGETISPDQANYNGNEVYGNGAKGKYRQKTTPVGSFKPNAFGLYDMHGNVHQWCADWYDADTYANSPKADPEGSWIGEDCRALRGGSWATFPWFCRSALRFRNGPGNRFNFIGFRVVVTDIEKK